VCISYFLSAPNKPCGFSGNSKISNGLFIIII
jgi:hypothetical protein